MGAAGGSLTAAADREHVPGQQSERPTVPGLGYQPALDGLRAIAAGSVLLYHGGVDWSSGGFLGVDVFFVLSGFLITALLLTEWERTGTIAIVSFYGRRLRRLLPAMLLVIAAVAVYAVTVAPTSQLHELRGDLVSTFGYFTNWRLVAADRGYFDAFATPSPLKHTWSLAVEEQWYLVWPVVVIGLLHLTRRRHRDLRPALVVVAVACVTSTIWMAVLYHPGQDPSRVYYGTDTRAQELLAGALLAFVCVIAGRYTLRRPWRGIIGIVGALALAWTFFLFTAVDDRTTWLYRGGLLVFSFAVVAVILAAVQPDGIVRAVLSPAPLRWLGTISYGLYLWHWPIYVVFTSSRTGLDGTALLLFRLGLTVVVATASYYLVERPIRHRTFSLRVVVPTVPAVIAATLAVVFLATSAATTTDDPLAAARAGSSTAPGAPGAAPSGQLQSPVPATTPGDTATRMVTTGDSVGLTLVSTYEQRSSTPPILNWDQSMLGCSLFPGDSVFAGRTLPDGPQCAPWRNDRTRWLQAFHPQVVMLLSGVWETYDREVDGRRLDFGTPEFDTWFSRHLDALDAELTSTGARLAILTAPCNEREVVSGPEPPENDNARIDHLNRLYERAAARHPGTTAIVDLHQRVCPGGRYVDHVDGTPLRSDGVHFTAAGSALTRAWLFPKLAALATRGS